LLPATANNNNNNINYRFDDEMLLSGSAQASCSFARSIKNVKELKGIYLSYFVLLFPS